jgi:MFS transporter, FSR family, fosmidomycin resistance protein
VTLLYLLIEFIDELVFGVHEAAWPVIRNDLGLTYAQIGILLGLPGILASLVEPFLGILGDVWKRRALILGGGVFFVLALVFTGLSHAFIPLLLATILFNPASGAFVSLSQGTLVDAEPEREEQNMARWTFAGSLGVTLGPLLLLGVLTLGWSWRPAFFLLALFAALILLAAWKYLPHAGRPHADFPTVADFLENVKKALGQLRNKAVVRWLILLEFSDLMLDVLLGYLALYFVDVAGFAPQTAGLAVAIWTVVGLLGDFLLIPLVERVKGLDYLRVSVVAELLLFPAFLLAPWPWLKLTLVALLGLFNAGWYAILKANLYAELPGQPGTVLVLDNISGLFGKLLPLSIGLLADTVGLNVAMWLLLAGPLALFIGLPRRLTTNS